MGGLSDDVVSGASAPFPLPSLKLVFAFNGSMPLKEMIPEATSNCLLSLSFVSFFFDDQSEMISSLFYL